MSSLPLDAIIGEIQGIVEEILKEKGDYKTIEIKPDRRQQYTIIEKAVGCLRRSETEIELFKAQVKGLFERIDKCELDRDARMKVIKRQQKDFSKKLEVIENDRSDRLDAIRKLGIMLDSAEAQSKARMAAIKELGKQNEDKAQEISELQGFDIRSLGFIGACSYFYLQE